MPAQRRQLKIILRGGYEGTENSETNAQLDQNTPAVSEEQAETAADADAAAEANPTAADPSANTDAESQAQNASSEDESTELHYSLGLKWNNVSTDEEKYNIKKVTTAKDEIAASYDLTIQTSKVNYAAGQMEVRLPYYLFLQRVLPNWSWSSDYDVAVEDNGIGVPLAPSTDTDTCFNYTIDTHQTEDRADDEIVISNFKTVPAGTNTVITVQYLINPYHVKDMDTAVIQAKGSCTAEGETVAEQEASNTITYQLDTGIDSLETYRSDKVSLLHSKPAAISQDQWDPENYHYFAVPLRMDAPSNQGVWLNTSLNVGEDGEIVAGDFSESYDETQTIPEKENGTYSFRVYQKPNSMKDIYLWNESTLYVRYPISSGDNHDVSVVYKAVAYDDDSHQEPEDQNDIKTYSFSLALNWTEYQYEEQTERFSKWNYQKNTSIIDQLVEQKESTQSWFLSETYDGNTIPDGSSQKLEIYEDAMDFLGDGTLDTDYEVTSVEFSAADSFSFSRTDTTTGAVTYPDIPESKVWVDGYKDGQWIPIDYIQIKEQTNRTSERVIVPTGRSKRVEIAKGSGYKRVRIRTDELPQGKLELLFIVGTRVYSGDWLTDYHQKYPDQDVDIYNYAATKHYTKQKDESTYQWDNALESPKLTGDRVQSLLERDSAEHCYESGQSGGYMLRATGKIYFRGAHYDSAFTKSYTYGNDKSNSRAIATVELNQYEEVRDVMNTDENIQYVASLIESRGGVFYDLLPLGYHVDETEENSVVAYSWSRGYGLEPKREANAAYQVIPNYKNTHRDMVIVHATCKDSGVINVGANYTGDLRTGFRVQIKTYITWKELSFLPGGVNISAFQREDGKEIVGSDAYSDQGYITENDDFYSVKGSDNNPALRDVDSDGLIEDKSTMYAKAMAQPDPATALDSGIIMYTSGDSGKWLESDQVDVSNNYAYLVGVLNASNTNGTINNLVVYDILEDVGDNNTKTIAGYSGNSTWKGTFDSIDLTSAEAQGFEPTVYYSTTPGLSYDGITGDDSQSWLEKNPELWTTEMPADKSKITAIAVDLREKKDGSAAALTDGDSISFIINMKAPDKYPEGVEDAHALNRPAYYCYLNNIDNQTRYLTDVGNGTAVNLAASGMLTLKKTTKGDASTPDDTVFTITGPDGTDKKVKYSDFNDGQVTLTDLPLGTYHIEEDRESAAVDDHALQVSYKNTTVSDKATETDTDGTTESNDVAQNDALSADTSESTDSTETDADGLDVDISTSGHLYQTVEITNVYNTKLTVSGNKVWHDSNNQDGRRPDSITVDLLQNGEKVDSQTVTADEDWKWAFTDLDKYDENGEEITYQQTEEAVDGYSTAYAVSPDGTTIANTYTPAQTSVSVTKNWDDANNKDGIRPESVTVQLLADGSVAENQTLTLSPSNNWTASFTGLPKMAQGKEIAYTVKELPVDGYKAKITGNAAQGFVITNSHTPAESVDSESSSSSGGSAKISVDVTKAWKDDGNKEGIRPDSVTIQLLADGKETGKTLKLSASNAWKGRFMSLPWKKNGKTVQYSVKEAPIDGYTSTISGTATEGYTVTNTLDAKSEETENPDEPGEHPSDDPNKGETTMDPNSGQTGKGEVTPAGESGTNSALQPANSTAGNSQTAAKNHSAKDDSQTSTAANVITGDSAWVLFWTLLLLAAGAVILLLMHHKKSMKN